MDLLLRFTGMHAEVCIYHLLSEFVFDPELLVSRNVFYFDYSYLSGCACDRWESSNGEVMLI